MTANRKVLVVDQIKWTVGKKMGGLLVKNIHHAQKTKKGWKGSGIRKRVAYFKTKYAKGEEVLINDTVVCATT